MGKQQTGPVAAVVGGGACGLAAAVSLLQSLERADCPARVIVLERMPRVGKKILATGNGRCNLSNAGAGESGYFGGDALAQRVLRQVPVSRTLRFFEDLGLLTKEEGQGRIYPDCEQAASVLEVLRLECQRLGAEILTGCQIESITQANGRFRLQWPDGNLFADTVLLCCGGKAAPELGSDGSGYRLARALGHTITPVYPALVQMKSPSKLPRQLKGVRKKCSIRLEIDGRVVGETAGEVQFTDYGISGIAAMELSRFVGAAALDGSEHRIIAVLDLMPQFSAERLLRLIQARQAKAPELPAGSLLTGMVHSRLGQVLVKQSGVDLTMPACALPPEDTQKLVTLLKHWTLRISGTMGFSGAQVTAGGVDVREVEPATLESRRCRNLFIGGELLDVDGACGGYNLQWAWSSGLLAAEHMANILINRAEEL